MMIIYDYDGTPHQPSDLGVQYFQSQLHGVSIKHWDPIWIFDTQRMQVY